MGGWVMNGTPSIALGSAWPWKWMPVVSCRLFWKVARRRSPSVTRSSGPVQLLLKPSAWTGALTASVRWLISSTVSWKTLVEPSTV